jgi:2-iminobutanoate/2-iminopropanoate deaminase
MSMGVRMDDLVFSSRIVGTDTVSGTTPDDPQHQATLAFDNVRTLLARAGGTPADLTQVTAFITTDRDRDVTQRAFDSMFIGQHAPPRLTFLKANLPGGASVRLEVNASIGDGASI